MKALNEKHVYDLSELTSEELNNIWEYLTKNDEHWYTCPLEEVLNQSKTDRLLFDKHNWQWCNISNPTTNAKELFYTLENIQVDCRELSEEQVKEMASVFENSGYKAWDDPNAFKKTQDDDDYLRLDRVNDFYINCKSDDKTTITYSKFMELFSNKEENFKKLVEVLNEELTEETERQITLKDLEKTQVNSDVDFYTINKQKPRQYQMGIDTFTRCESNMTKEEILACCKFNIDKYNWRDKGQDLEDLEKIISYANWAIKQLKQQ